MTNRELDALVAEKVMGWRVERRASGNLMAILPDDCRLCIEHNQGILPAALWNPSEDIGSAFHLVEELRERKMAFVLGANAYSEQFSVWFFDGIWALAKQQNAVPEHGDSHLFGVATTDSAPRAICLAALKAVGVEVQP